MTDLLVDRGDLQQTRLVESPAAVLEAGQARLRVEAFGLSANNVTYAVVGDLLGYWAFFPAEDGWGRVPVWGFASVVESREPSLEVGRRVFGYLPMSTELVVDAGRVDERGFTDVAAHRAPMASAYNRYRTVSSEPGSDDEDRWMLLQPLFFTAWLADDFLADQGDFGAGVVVISSASSKTASGIAHLAARRGVRLVGLTSPANVAFTAGLGVYDLVLGYDELGGLPDGPAVYVDVSGSTSIRAAVHERYGEGLVHDMVIGATHRDDRAPGSHLPGARPTFFFAPAQIDKRTQDWGGAELEARIAASWTTYAPWAAHWIDFRHSSGLEAAGATYRELLDNRADPTVGHVVTLSTP